jgi:hypothetical protein
MAEITNSSARWSSRHSKERVMELLKRQETWNITYDHALGETASYFFTQIRDTAARLFRPNPRADQGMGRSRAGRADRDFHDRIRVVSRASRPPLCLRLREARRCRHGDRWPLPGNRPQGPGRGSNASRDRHPSDDEVHRQAKGRGTRLLVRTEPALTIAGACGPRRHAVHRAWIT